MSRKTIVYFSARYLPSFGGVEQYTHNLAAQLARSGHKVCVVTCEKGPQDDIEQFDGGGTLEVCRLDSWGWSRVPFVAWTGRTRAALRHVDALQPDYSLINTRFYGLSRLGARRMGRLGVRSVLVDHGTNYVSVGSKLASRGIQALEHVLTERLKRLPVDFYGVSKGSSRWLATFGITSCGEINNALDADTFAGAASDRVFAEGDHTGQSLRVAFAARLIAEKGADTIIDVARAFAPAGNVEFFVAGAGPLEEEVRAAANELPNLFFVGRLDHPDLAALLSQSDVFLLPTRYGEGLPTSLLEAAACGCALVSTKTGGTEEIIPTEEHGVVLETTGADEITHVLTELAGDPARTKRLKETARNYVRERFTWRRTMDQALKACESAQRKGTR